MSWTRMSCCKQNWGSIQNDWWFWNHQARNVCESMFFNDMVGNGFGTSVTDKAVIIRCCAMGYLVGKQKAGARQRMPEMMMPAANPKDAIKFSVISGEKHCQWVADDSPSVEITKTHQCLKDQTDQTDHLDWPFDHPTFFANWYISAAPCRPHSLILYISSEALSCQTHS